MKGANHQSAADRSRGVVNDADTRGRLQLVVVLRIDGDMRHKLPVNATAVKAHHAVIFADTRHQVDHRRAVLLRFTLRRLLHSLVHIR